MLTAKPVAKAATYDWEYSLDTSTWTPLPETMSTRTELPDLTSAGVYYFRFRALTRKGQRDYSPVVSLYVHSPAANAQRRALAERNLRPAYPFHLRAYIQKEKLMQSELYRSIFAEGEQQGERKGLQQGLRQAIMDLCEILGIELTPERRAEIEQLDPTQLSQLRTHLKSARAWPLARS